MVFDKTGTLTVGRPTVTASKVFGPHRLEDVLALASAAEAHSEHPLGTAILAYARHVSQSHSTLVASSSSDVTDTSWLQRADEFEAVPGQGVRAKVEGQEILVGNRRMMHSHGVHVPLGAEEALQNGEQRARTGVLVAVNRELAAVLAISDPLKAEAPAVVAALKRMGIRSVMMTGDNADTARVVAEEVRPPGGADSQRGRFCWWQEGVAQRCVLLERKAQCLLMLKKELMRVGRAFFTSDRASCACRQVCY